MDLCRLERVMYVIHAKVPGCIAFWKLGGTATISSSQCRDELFLCYEKGDIS